MKWYLASLDKTAVLEVDQVLPGHRRLIGDHRTRIEELKRHHAARLAEALGILNNGPLSAFETAAQMTWDIRCDTWDEFPVMQQWFATGEAISHLRYLEEEGKVERTENGGQRTAGRGRRTEDSEKIKYRLTGK